MIKDAHDSDFNYTYRQYIDSYFNSGLFEALKEDWVKIGIDLGIKYEIIKTKTQGGKIKEFTNFLI